MERVYRSTHKVIIAYRPSWGIFLPLLRSSPVCNMETSNNHDRYDSSFEDEKAGGEQCDPSSLQCKTDKEDDVFLLQLFHSTHQLRYTPQTSRRPDSWKHTFPVDFPQFKPLTLEPQRFTGSGRPNTKIPKESKPRVPLSISFFSLRSISQEQYQNITIRTNQRDWNIRVDNGMMQSHCRFCISLGLSSTWDFFWCPQVEDYSQSLP